MAGQHAFHDEGSAPTPPLKVLELGDEALLDDVMTSSREGAPLSEEAGDGGPAEGPPRAHSLGMLGGARADFVAELGRRVAELTSLAGQLSADPKSTRLRDDLRRRMHGLAAGARLLRFNRLAARLAESEALLHAAAARGEIAPDGVAGLCAVFDQLPALAWGEVAVGAGGHTPLPGRAGLASAAPRAKSTPPQGTARDATGQGEPEPKAPVTALVVGSPLLADALTLDRAGVAYEVERADDGAGAIDLARALAPDIIVVDADRPGAHALCEALCEDPLMEAVPFVVVGQWAHPDEAAPFVALGAARTLVKPVSPGALRRACIEAGAVSGRRDLRGAPVGRVSVDELGARLVEELRRGLGDAAVVHGRGARVDLGEGSEVLAPLWGAVARIRDVVTIRSSGQVRFSASGPEGALRIASWIGDEQGRAAAFGEARAGAVSLAGKVVVVADDDPAVTWFLAGVLRASGALVHEAHEGARALEIAHRVTPDLVISDVIMPVLDGFALCRALKRDLVLRDVPVILLSWKEDLLQRVRELGGGADGYLRKEASAPVIVHRVREVLRPRARVEERLAASGEVRGRLDGFTTRTLLGLACSVRPDATVVVRDASFLYEVELRGGRPARATRTSADGAFEHGPEVLAALLAVGAGRFVVGPASAEAISIELQGSLDDQILPHLASARAAQRLLSGAELVAVEHVELDEGRLGDYAGATPEPARALLRALAAGASPRALISSGEAAARLVEDVLADAAAHGAVAAILDADGEDRLGPAVEREIEILRGAPLERAPVEPPPLDLGPIIYTSTPAPVETVAPSEPAVALPEPHESAAPPVVLAPEASSLRAVPASAPPVLADLEPAEESRALARVKPMLSLGSLTPPPVAPAPRPRLPAPSMPVITSLEETPSRTVRKPSSFVAPRAPERPERSEAKDAKDAKADTAKPSRSMWGLFAVAGIVFAVGARLSRERELSQRAAPLPAPAITAEARAAEPAPPAPAPPEADTEGASKVDPILPQEGPFRADDKVPPGQGMLEVVAGTSDTVWIDGTLVGNGPIVKRALAPRKEPYEIRVKLRGEERVRFALVKEARLTRLRIAPPWSR